MRRFVLIALLPLAACSAAHDTESRAATNDSGDGPSGESASRSFAVDGFTAIDMAGPDDVDIRVGPGFSVRAEGDAKALARLEITRNGDTLQISRKSGMSFWGGGHGAKVYVTMPRITAANATGSGDLSIDHVDGEAFTARSTGAGDIAIGSLTTRKVALSLIGAGNLTAAGTAGSGSLSTTGAGDIEAPALKLSSATVSVTGVGSVSAAVSGPATVELTGPGDVTLTGGAKCTISKTGPGDVTCS